MRFHTQDHYEQLAETYERTWAERPEYVAWMAGRIMAALDLEPQSRVADIGSGTGLFLRRLMDLATADTPILCVDPSQPMLDRLPGDPRLQPLCATAEQIGAGEVPLPYDRLDAVVFKEAVHHVTDIPATLKNLTNRLAPGGRILIVTLPPRLDYPLFTEALDRFAARQPDPWEMSETMGEAGLTVNLTFEEFPVTIDRDTWLTLVEGRWMSVLSTFTDEELEDGLARIRAGHPGPQVSYVDRFAFIKGTLG